MTKAEQARQRAEQEKVRLAALEKKGADESGDVLHIATQNGDHATTPPTNSPEPVKDTEGPPNGLSADRPITPPPSTTEKKKIDRQGIDLRPEDRDRILRFELFCMQNRMKTGKKRGLSLYARVGFSLLEDLIERDPAAASALIKKIGEA